MLQTIDKCVNYSNKVINDLLDYSREIHIDLQECSPRQLIAEALAMLDLPENISVTNSLSDNPRITVDPEKMQRVFVNLTKNAIDALPHGGKISIKGKVIDDKIQISFSDDGVGISEEILPKLFSPLFTTKAQGMGFGLAICKRIIEAHGGTISVNTAKDKGTTFVITLPIEQSKQTGGEIIIWNPITES
jgi:two-component system sensor histidine kinase HydH